jgi:hypothetical protein
MLIERKNQTFQKIDFLGRVVGRFKNLQNLLADEVSSASVCVTILGNARTAKIPESYLHY